MSNGFLQVLSNPLHNGLAPLRGCIAYNDLVLELNNQLLDTHLITIVDNDPVNIRKILQRSLDLEVLDTGVLEGGSEHVSVELGNNSIQNTGNLLWSSLGGKALLLIEAVKETLRKLGVEGDFFNDKVFEHLVEVLGGRVVDGLYEVGELNTLDLLVVGEVEILGGLAIDGVLLGCADDVGDLGLGVENDSDLATGVMDCRLLVLSMLEYGICLPAGNLIPLISTVMAEIDLVSLICKWLEAHSTGVW